MSNDDVTMQDYLEDVNTEQQQTTSDDDPGSGYPYDQNTNRHGTPQRCRWCGKDFETLGRRNHWLNMHESDCEERGSDE